MDDDWKNLAPIANNTFLWNDTWLIGRLKSLSKSKDPIENDPLYLMLLTLALCHSANVFDKHVDENTGTEVIKGNKSMVLIHIPIIGVTFHTSSPDEKALLEAAQNFGFCFLSRDFDTIKVNVFGRIRSFTLLHVLEFTGERKRMSIIAKDENERILLLTKGT
jgi:magnesium-transporting ATPase (P-type)